MFYDIYSKFMGFSVTKDVFLKCRVSSVFISFAVPTKQLCLERYVGLRSGGGGGLSPSY